MDKNKSKFSENIKYLFNGYREIIKITPSFLPYAFIMAFINALQPTVILFFSAKILNELSGAKNFYDILFYTSITVLLTFLLSLLKSFISAKQELNTGYFITFFKFLAVQAEKFITMDYSYTENSEIRNTLNDIETKTKGNGVGLMNLYYNTQNNVQNIFSLILSVLLLVGMFSSKAVYTENFFTSPAAMFILLALILAGMFTVFIYRRKEKAVMEEALNHNAKGNSTAWYYFGYVNSDQAAKDIRLYNQKDTLNQVFETNYGLKQWLRFFFFDAGFNGYSASIMALIGGAVYLLIGLRALAGMYEIGSIVQYVGAVTALIGCVNQLVSGLGELYNNCIYIKPLVDYLNMPDILEKGSRPIKPQNGHKYEFEFRNVSFRYPETETYVIKNLNMKINSGQRLAVVGLNGSGKTTMIKLLCRLYDPDEGEILLDNINIKEYDYDSYRKLFSVVFQDFKLFPLSLGQNVAVNLNPDEVLVAECLENAGFGERLDNFDKKLDTILYKNFDKDGVQISGGEAQKIALARALYKNAPVIVLDEPTAALDPIAEFEVYSTFNKTIGDKTAVFISHRLSSCRFCHDIAVFENGELIQRDNHENLLSDRSGRYFELWNAQAQHYVTQEN